MTVPVQGPPAERGPRTTLVTVAALALWGFVGFYLWYWGGKWAVDLRVYRGAAADLLHHGAPYTASYTESHLPFTYPPFALLLFTPLAFGPIGLVKALWWLLTTASLLTVLSVAITAALGVSRRRAVVLALAIGALSTIALEPLRNNLDFGQINVVLMALVALDVLKVRGRGRGVLVGVAAAIKLTPLVYLAFFLVERDRRAALRGLATFAGATALSAAILPGEATRYWLHDAFSPSRTGHPGFETNQSWYGLLHRAPFHAGPTGVVLWALLSLVTLAVALVAAQRLVGLGRPVDALLGLALAELLVSPISWSHHWSWLVLVPVVVVGRWGKDRPVTGASVVVLAVALAEPYWWPVGGWFGAVAKDSLTLAGAVLLAVLAWRARAAPGVRPGGPEGRPAGDVARRSGRRGWAPAGMRREATPRRRPQPPGAGLSGRVPDPRRSPRPASRPTG